MSVIESKLINWNKFFGGKIEDENEYLVISETDDTRHFDIFETFDRAKLFYDDTKAKNTITYIKMYKIGVRAVSDMLKYGTNQN